MCDKPTDEELPGAIGQRVVIKAHSVVNLC